MTIELFEALTPEVGRRRVFLQAAGLALSSFGVGQVFAQSGQSSDVGVMQGALALEHEGIAAYQIAGASGLLTPGTLKIALIFLGHHKQHRDSLVALITKAGGKPVDPKTDAEYTKALGLATLKSEEDVVKLATNLEQGAANAYAGQVAALQDRQLTHLFTQLSADEAVHWATLNNALGREIPAKAYLFG